MTPATVPTGKVKIHSAAVYRAMAQPAEGSSWLPGPRSGPAG